MKYFIWFTCPTAESEVDLPPFAIFTFYITQVMQLIIFKSYKVAQDYERNKHYFKITRRFGGFCLIFWGFFVICFVGNFKIFGTLAFDVKGFPEKQKQNQPWIQIPPSDLALRTS